jgi:hypothetical protein
VGRRGARKFKVDVPAATPVVQDEHANRQAEDIARQVTGPRIYTRSETREQFAAAEQLLMQFASEGQIGTALRDRWGCSAQRTRLIIRRVRERWSEQAREANPHAREQHIRAIRRSIAQVEAQMRTIEAGEVVGRDSKGDPIRQLSARGRSDLARFHNAKSRYLELLADVEGTKTPAELNINLRADVRISEAITNVMVDLTADQVMELQAEYRETQQLAEKYKREHAQLLPYTNGSAE